MLTERFDILGESGKGPTGTVFQAREKETGKMVAVKLVPPSQANEFIIQRLAAEWEKVHALAHENIVKVSELTKLDDASHVIVSDFTEGMDVMQAVRTNGKLSVQEALIVIGGVAAGLQAAHDQNLLHLNIKPQNVLISGDPQNVQIKITDFALWRSGADPGEINSHLAFYQSPEQRRNSELSCSCDVYALGKLLYVLVSGETAGRITPESVPNNAQLQEVVYRCIRTSPQDRYPTMQGVLEALAAIPIGPGDESSQQAATTSQGSRLPRLTSTSVPAAAPMNETPAQVQVAHGKVRASLELDSMLAAVGKHLDKKRLKTCRELLTEIQQKASDYSDLEGPEWLQSHSEELDNLIAELEQRETELHEMLVNAASALEERKFEDCLLYCSAAQEICTESLDIEKYQERAKKQIANSNVFWEEAHRAMTHGFFNKAEIACVKLLDIRPDHEEALEMRRRIRSRRQRKRVLKASLVLALIASVLAIPGGFFGVWHFRRQQQINQFEALREQEKAADAERIAQGIKDYHKPALDFLAARKKLGNQITYMIQLRDKINVDSAAEKRETSEKWSKAEASRLAIQDDFSLGKHASAEATAVDTIELYKEILSRLMILEQVLPAIEQERWQFAHDKLQEVLELVPGSKAAESLLAHVKKSLVPELTIRTMAGDSELTGAHILLNGERQTALTPRPVRLQTGKTYRLRIFMPPSGETYYKPHEQTVRLDRDEARTIIVQLESLIGPAEDQAWTVPEINLDLQPVKPGTFQMGSQTGDPDEQPIRIVTISRAFWFGTYEVMQDQYERIMGSNPSVGSRGPRYPANNISWQEAVEFCQRLTRREQQAHRLPDGYVYRLPTEAEWAYAAKAGSPLVPDIEQVAWYDENAGAEGFQEVGLKFPNPWGLHDMLGNVAEWCWDWYSLTAYNHTPATDPFGPSQGSQRVIRGASRIAPAEQCRYAKRFKLNPQAKSAHIGFRVVLAPRE